MISSFSYYIPLNNNKNFVYTIIEYMERKTQPYKNFI